MKMIDNLVKKSLETSSSFMNVISAIATCAKDISNLNITITALLRTLEAHQKMILMLEEAVTALAKSQESIYAILSSVEEHQPEQSLIKKKPTNGDLN